MSNSLDPDQAGRSVGPDLVTNCLQKISADTLRELISYNIDSSCGRKKCGS